MISRSFRFILIGVVLFFSSYAYSQIPDDIEIEGDEIFYTKNNQVLNVKGNVKLIYETYQVEAEEFYYDMEDDIVRFPKAFVFKQEAESIKGQDMFYDGKKRRGYAKNIDANFYGVTVRGQALNIEKDKFVLENTFCSSCKEAKGYHVRSKSIEMYYILGILIAKNSKISLDFFPFQLPIPFFIYGDSKLGVMEETNIFPELGSNKPEGTYVKQRFSYILNPNLAGSIQLASTYELGSFLGGNTRYFINENFVLNTSYFYGFLENNFRGKIHFSYLFPQVLATSNGLFSSLASSFKQSNHMGAKIDLLYQYKLLENDEFVNYSPLFKLKVDKFTFFNLFDYDLDMSAGIVGELQQDRFLEMGRLKYKANLIYTRPITSSFSLEANNFLDFTLYGNNTNWRRGFQSVGVVKKGFLNPKLSFNKRLFNNGQSPFNHEQNYAIVSDELGFSFSQKLKSFHLHNSNFYSIENKQFRNSTWEIDMIFDCWKIGLGWKSANEQFYFRFELL